MKRTATVAVLLLFTGSSAPGAPTRPKDPEPFLVAFTPDGGRIVVAMRWAGIKVLSIPDLKEIRSFAVEDDRAIRSAAVSPSGRWLAVDRDAKDLRIWNLETGDAQLTVSTGSAFRGYFFSPDDTFIVFQHDTLQVWDVKEARKRRAVDASRVERMALSPDGRYLAVGGTWGRACLVGQSSRDICLYATRRDQDDDVRSFSGAGGRGRSSLRSGAPSLGPERLRTMRIEMQSWMAEHEYTSVESMRGCMNILRAPNPGVFSRANYMRILQTWVPE